MSELIHTHNLTSGLVGILIKIIEKVKETNKNKVHIQRDLELTHNEFCNLQKLRYWGLIAKYKEHGIHLPGYWVITRQGGTFLRNEMDMPKKVLTQSNHVIEKSLERVRISDFFREDLYPQSYWQENYGGIRLEQPALL